MQTKGEQTRYQYDPLGRRILKASEDNQTRFYWLGDCLLKEVQTSAAKGTESTTYLFEPEQGNGESFKPVAVVKADAAHPQGAVYHIHTDHLGTPQEVSNAEGQIIWAAQYRAYGALKRQLKVAGSDVHVADQPDRSFTQNLRFMGQYFDEETGLHYNRHRYYDPECGQFISQDPIGLLGGLNNYQYVTNPVSWVDPLGLCEGYGISNPLPQNGVFSRVMPKKYALAFAEGKAPIAAGEEVWVGAADDLFGVTRVSDAQEKLSLFTDFDATKPNLSGDMLVKFKLKDINSVGLRSPIETNPERGYGFIHGGRTAGGNREWLINKGTASELGAYDIEVIPLER